MRERTPRGAIDRSLNIIMVPREMIVLLKGIFRLTQYIT
jgi:hypothetical protein